MNMSFSRATLAIIPALAMLTLAVPSSAQQGMNPAAPAAPAVQQAPAVSQAPAAPAQAAQPAQAASARRRNGHAGRSRRQTAQSRRRRAPRIVAMVDVQVGRRAGQGGHDRARLCLAGDLDDLHREDDRADRDSAQAARGAGQDRRRTVAGGSAICAGLQGQRAGVVARGGDARGAAVGGHLERRRHQGTRRVAL